jgi:membrane protein YdbS with pleckstrin-like domain
MTTNATNPTWLRTSSTYRVCSAMRASIWWLAILIIIGVASLFLPSFTGLLGGRLAFAPLAALAVLACLIWSAVTSFLVAASIRYQLLDDEILYESGVLNHRRVTLPYTRIQTVSQYTTFIDRMLGLSHVVCQSAADQSNVTLPGLPAVQAEATRALLSTRSRAARSNGGRDHL